MGRGVCLLEPGRPPFITELVRVLQENRISIIYRLYIIFIKIRMFLYTYMSLSRYCIQKVISFKPLDHVTMEAGKSKIFRVSQQAGDPGQWVSSLSPKGVGRVLWTMGRLMLQIKSKAGCQGILPRLGILFVLFRTSAE